MQEPGCQQPLADRGVSALDGLCILDFSHALAGPYCTLLLADYGANIYKIESPAGGDMGRGWGPPFIGDQSAVFAGLNRGKYGVAIDLKHTEGIDLCLRLVERMDVLIENFRPGVMDRLGLGYHAVRGRNPRLIYCSITGYGQDGPARDETAMDLVVQCSSGLISITGTEAGEQVRCGYGISDVTAGLFAAIGILTALRSRDQTGKGQYVDVSMLDGMISTMTSNFMSYLGSEHPPRPLGTAFPTIVPYRVYDAKDRNFGLAVGSEKLWSALCQVIERPDLESHPDFATNPLRVKNRACLEPMLDEAFQRHSAAEWVETLQAAGIPCSLVRTFPEVVAHPQAAFRDMFPLMDHPPTIPHRVTGTPVKLSDTPGRHARPAPSLGQHTRQVLNEILGLDHACLDRLGKEGIVFEAGSQGKDCQ